MVRLTSLVNIVDLLFRVIGDKQSRLVSITCSHCCYHNYLSAYCAYLQTIVTTHVFNLGVQPP